MTKVVYFWTKDNATKGLTFNTLAEVMAQVEKSGGHFKATYKPITKKYEGANSGTAKKKVHYTNPYDSCWII